MSTQAYPVRSFDRSLAATNGMPLQAIPKTMPYDNLPSGPMRVGTHAQENMVAAAIGNSKEKRLILSF